MSQSQATHVLDRAKRPGLGTRRWSRSVFILIGIVTNAGLLVWSYWPTACDLITVWSTQSDYTHGFFVLPMAIVFLFLRRDSFPGWDGRIGWLGVALLAASLALRLIGWKFHLSPLEGWSMVCWIAGATWFLAGWKVLRWSWPVIAFLMFMIPIPYRLEMLFSLPLQSVATICSAWALQLIGEPAVVEGNTIYLSGYTLEVAQACSGLRILMTSLTLACGFAIALKCFWPEAIVLLLAALPIALIANVFRIALTGYLCVYASNSLTNELIHDLPGWLMIPLASILFALLIAYLSSLFPVVELQIQEPV